MKIAIFSNEFPPNIYGGAGVHVDFLTQELARLATVEVRCFGDQVEDNGNMHVRGVNFSLGNAMQNEHPQIKMFQNLSRDIEMARATPEADIIHCHT